MGRSHWSDGIGQHRQLWLYEVVDKLVVAWRIVFYFGWHEGFGWCIMCCVVGQRPAFRRCGLRNELSMLGVEMRVDWEEDWRLRVSLEGWCV